VREGRQGTEITRAKDTKIGLIAPEGAQNDPNGLERALEIDSGEQSFTKESRTETKTTANLNEEHSDGKYTVRPPLAPIMEGGGQRAKKKKTIKPKKSLRIMQEKKDVEADSLSYAHWKGGGSLGPPNC